MDDSLSRFILRVGVDDPVDAVAIHGGGGIIGIIAAPIFMENGANLRNRANYLQNYVQASFTPGVARR